jgi:DNA-binding transcriptional ArsR family regulator
MRALDRLRDGVQAAILRLGNGFLQHPRNSALDDAFRRGALTHRDYYRQLLRLAYRLIFLFVAEDRGALLPKLPDDAPPEARAAQDRYRRYYATSHLRALAQRRRGGPHADRWQALRLVLGHLHGGCPDLGLPALGSFLWSPDATPDLDRCELSNADLLAALHSLCTFDDGQTRRIVSWQNIGADELGSVYEALLELHPEVLREARTFKLEVAPGHERKTTGSYYTPSDLVECLLDTALDPVLDEAERSPDPVAILLDLKICDPACGSGHFLLAAGRRLARRLAQVRAGVSEPSPADFQHALREVVGRCLYGVDINDMAVELCKVSLWMEALEPGRPLSFLDSHIQQGNALVGTTPALLGKGVPEAAFEALTGDDPAVARRLKKRNRDEHSRSKAQGVQMGLGEAAPAVRVDTSSIARKAADIDQLGDGDFAAVTTKQRRYLEFIDSPELRDTRFLADAWCAAFVWSKTEATETIAPTQALLQILHRDPSSAPTGLRDAVTRLAASYQFFQWHIAFPHVFAEPRGGFDVILGNPPWERIKLQEREFFATRAPEIADARNASERKKVIAALERKNPALWEEWLTALRQAEGESHQVRNSGRYPLCGRGDINTYAIFAELNRGLIRDRGRVGCIVPAGIAMDDTTKLFFADLVQTRSLAALLHFENEDKIFAAVHNAYRFVLLTLSGHARPVETAKFVAYARQVSALSDPERLYSLSPADFALISPNTGAFPAFRSRRDAELTRAIHRRVPVLVRESDPVQNPWGVVFRTMLHMANDSGLFHTREALRDDGWRLIGTTFVRDTQQRIPLYEAKMIHHFDHRFGTYEGQTQAQANKGFLPYLNPEQHDDPKLLSLPRYWVDRQEVDSCMEGRWRYGWVIVWRDITGSEKTRTVVASVLPRYAAGHTSPLLFVEGEFVMHASLLAANLSSVALDYVARQKVGGIHLTFGLINQLPILTPTVYNDACAWSPGHSLAEWLRVRVLELTYTAWDITAFARDHGWDGPPFRWDEARRFLLRAELDAAFFHLYGINEADDVAYILGTFPIVRQRDQKEHGTYRTKDQILAIHERMRLAMAGGPPYATPLDPPPADPSLTHPPLAPDDPLWQVIPQTRPPSTTPADARPDSDTRAASTVDGATAPLFPDEPTSSKPRKPTRPREKPTRASPPAASPSPTAFELAHPPTPQPHLFPAAPPTQAKSKPSTTASFHLHSPAAPSERLFAPAPTPSTPATPATPALAAVPDDPPFLRHLFATEDASLTPDLVAVLRALHRAGAPASKTDLLAATNLDEPRWTRAIRQLLDAGLVDKEGERRWTRYRLTRS